MNDSPEGTGPLSRALAKLGRVTYQYPWFILGFLLITLIPSLILASGLTVRSSFLELLPEERPAVRELHEVLEHTHATSQVLVAIANDDPELARRFANGLVQRLSNHPMVRGVDAHFEIEFFHDRQLLYVEEDELRRLIERVREAVDREVVRQTGFYFDLEDDEDATRPTDLLAEVDESPVPFEPWMVTEDERWLCAWVIFGGASGDLEHARQAHSVVSNAIAELADDPAFPALPEFRLVGGIAQRLQDHEQITTDLATAGSVGFLAVVLLMVASLRSPRAIVLLAAPLLVGLIWTFAFARVAVGHLNIISGFLFSILSGLGIEYGIHLHHRYVELRREGASALSATEQLMASTGRALVAIGATNASVFFVSALADFSGFREFGRIAAAGMWLTLLSTLLGFPALNALFERWRPMKVEPAPAESRRGIHVPRIVRNGVLLAIPAFAIASIVALYQGAVRFEGDWRVLQGDTEEARFSEYIREQLEGTFTNAIIWVEDPAERQRVVDAIARVEQQRHDEERVWDVTQVQRIDDVVPSREHQEARRALILELREQLLRISPARLDSDEDRRRLEQALGLTQAEPFTIDDVPEFFVRPFRAIGDSGTLLLLRVARTYRETDDIIEWAEQAREVRAAIHEAGPQASILSENWIAGEIFETIFADGPRLLFGTLLAVFIVLLLDLRSFAASVIVLGGVLIGLIGLAGAMALFKVDLNFMNAGILPVCVGISLDNAIHIYHRYRVEGAKAIPIVLKQTSSANLLSSSTNLLGFGALALAHHNGLRSVAYLAVLGVALTYVSTSIFLPLALERFGRRRAPIE
jgi:predicted RND superfamily exporter protein